MNLDSTIARRGARRLEMRRTARQTYTSRSVKLYYPGSGLANDCQAESKMSLTAISAIQPRLLVADNEADITIFQAIDEDNDLPLWLNLSHLHALPSTGDKEKSFG